MEITGVGLDPAFDAEVFDYEGITYNASNTLKVFANDDEATVTIKLNDNGVNLTEGQASLSWNLGVNEVEITVVNDDQTSTYTIEVVRKKDSRLVSLAIGDLELSPTFNSDVLAYETETENVTDIVTAAAKDSGSASISIDLNDGTMVNNGEAATWGDGENILTITVTNDGEESIYVVEVTKI